MPGTSVRARCQVVVVDGPDKGRACTLDARGITVGTDTSCELCLSDDRVSHRHLRVAIDERRFVVTDLGSTNGTLYEGSLITEARVPPGATFKLGRSFVRITPEARAIEVPASRARSFGELVGESIGIREVFAVLELAARGDATVLLEGETGTGKELAARALHDEGPRRKGPFVAVDCGALPEGLLESELFGHVRGAFTGASNTRVGAFARAHGGTLFLDELGAVSPAVQSRLLRAIETRAIRPVGSDAERAVDARIVAASRHDLLAAVADGSFRPDLYYRLSVIRVLLTPLRTRREDIAPLIEALLRRRGITPGPIDGPALDPLMVHPWPGNVRELRNVIDRALALSPGQSSFRDLRIAIPGERAPEESSGVRTDLPWREARELVLHAFERRYLRAMMARTEGNLSAAARLAGLDRKHLRGLLKRHGERPEDPDENTPIKASPAPRRR